MPPGSDLQQLLSGSRLKGPNSCTPIYMLSLKNHTKSSKGPIFLKIGLKKEEEM